ncbi:uncharacterized protein LOC114804269 [Zeugodacus cucurbitae]|uniref:uncharacterized protein LOC114804269 n=1 Tax=Zeugodacus cucurbitae TaxID=28588 RepID=UPI0023D8F9FE|nr:uncharacterized protein LOC114804269 [Zeugodacus cucurbitae]
MDWRQAEIFDLLSMYRESECLWNCLNPEYKDVKLKQNAWKEIATFFGRNVEEVKKKIKNLRTSYVIEKKKVDSKKTNSGGSLYEPSLFYYDEMTFLDPVIILRICNPTEQSTDPLCELRTKRSSNDKPIIAEKSTDSKSELRTKRSSNDRHIIAEKKKHKVFSSTPKDNAHSEVTPAKRLRVTNDIHLDNVPQNKLENKDYLSKEDTFCTMLCSELKLLKSEDIYDNVTSEIFTILRNAKIAERQNVCPPEEVSKVASKKM